MIALYLTASITRYDGAMVFVPRRLLLSAIQQAQSLLGNLVMNPPTTSSRDPEAQE